MEWEAGMEKGNGVELAPRILIVDDHTAARITIRELLDWHSFQVCGDAKDGKEAIEKVIELKPDIVLLDINMPGMSGISASAEIRRVAPATKIVFLTIHDSPGFRVGARPWAHGFVPKSAAGTDLIPTLQRIAGITANEITIECPHCRVEQKVHVAVRTGFAQEGSQNVSCINCHNEFDVTAPHKIVGGPFVA
jgi:DNA-binding NarL/FixJ family response regulator